MIVSILLCIAAFAVVVSTVRNGKGSLGLPVAYLFGLLLIHVPGAVAHSFPWSELPDTEFTETGIRFTAIGSVCFAGGVWLARLRRIHAPAGAGNLSTGQRFWLFCLVGGWFTTYAIIPFAQMPSLSAAIDKGSAVWMLGIMLGLRAAVQRQSMQVLRWGAAMCVYPILTLLMGGFLSYGSTAVMICLAPLVVSTRSRLRVVAGLLVIWILGFHVFLSYFKNREDIRDAVWGGAGIEVRIAKATKVFQDLSWFDPRDPTELLALDRRLNQNYFVGLAAARLEAQEVSYLNGRSLWEGLIALVPRAIWPDKPVFGGSPKIVSEMTGLVLAENTSFGVGNVMEFHINFGIPSLVVGFLILGWAIGRLDITAASAEGAGDIPRLIRCFLPAVALIQPNGSIVELASGVIAAWIGAIGWEWAWRSWSKRFHQQTVVTVGPETTVHPREAASTFKPNLPL